MRSVKELINITSIKLYKHTPDEGYIILKSDARNIIYSVSSNTTHYLHNKRIGVHNLLHRIQDSLPEAEEIIL